MDVLKSFRYAQKCREKEGAAFAVVEMAQEKLVKTQRKVNEMRAMLAIVQKISQEAFFKVYTISDSKEHRKALKGLDPTRKKEKDAEHRLSVAIDQRWKAWIKLDQAHLEVERLRGIARNAAKKWREARQDEKDG